MHTEFLHEHLCHQVLAFFPFVKYNMLLIDVPELRNESNSLSEEDMKELTTIINDKTLTTNETEDRLIQLALKQTEPILTDIMVGLCFPHMSTDCDDMHASIVIRYAKFIRSAKIYGQGTTCNMYNFVHRACISLRHLLLFDSVNYPHPFVGDIIYVYSIKMGDNLNLMPHIKLREPTNLQKNVYTIEYNTTDITNESLMLCNKFPFYDLVSMFINRFVQHTKTFGQHENQAQLLQPYIDICRRTDHIVPLLSSWELLTTDSFYFPLYSAIMEKIDNGETYHPSKNNKSFSSLHYSIVLMIKQKKYNTLFRMKQDGFNFSKVSVAVWESLWPCSPKKIHFLITALGIPKPYLSQLSIKDKYFKRTSDTEFMERVVYESAKRSVIDGQSLDAILESKISTFLFGKSNKQRFQNDHLIWANRMETHSARWGTMITQIDDNRILEMLLDVFPKQMGPMFEKYIPSFPHDYESVSMQLLEELNGSQPPSKKAKLFEINDS
jgi:hypothetical protein